MNEARIRLEGRSEAGFSLVETLVAMIVIMIAMLGTLQAINYSILYNAGNASRAQNLAILQQEVERLRSAKFTPSGIDNFTPPGDGTCRVNDARRDITGGKKAGCTIAAADGTKFLVKTCVDNNPFNGLDSGGNPTCDTDPIDPPGPTDISDANYGKYVRIKEITVEVGLDSPAPGWQVAIPARVVLRRTIGN